MPTAMMTQAQQFLGLGAFSADPVTIYLARTASLLYVAQGAGLWFLSCDVPRYRPLLSFCGKLFLAGALVYLVIDLAAGMPAWWTIIECVCLIAMGLSLTWCAHTAEQATSTQLSMPHGEADRAATSAHAADRPYVTTSRS